MTSNYSKLKFIEYLTINFNSNNVMIWIFEFHIEVIWFLARRCFFRPVDTTGKECTVSHVKEYSSSIKRIFVFIESTGASLYFYAPYFFPLKSISYVAWRSSGPHHVRRRKLVSHRKRSGRLLRADPRFRWEETRTRTEFDSERNVTPPQLKAALWSFCLCRKWSGWEIFLGFDFDAREAWIEARLHFCCLKFGYNSQSSLLD